MFYANISQPKSRDVNLTMDHPPAEGLQRSFLLLQGPHGPFFSRLGRILRASGANVWRCGFNAGDEYFWADKSSFIRHAEPLSEWPRHLAQIFDQKKITDIVLYGDVRPVHAIACQQANRLGLRVHVFEEGYLRPYWISYERDGSNGNSAIMRISLDAMRTALRKTQNEIHRPPARWGDMRHHKFYGAAYHFLVLAANQSYRSYRSHRAISGFREFRLNLRRFLLSPVMNLATAFQWRKFRGEGWPFSLVLMQLEHDSNFLGHSQFDSNAEFIDRVLGSFARNAPRHHHLVFKAHPLEDGRARNRAEIRYAAKKYGIPERVHYLSGGKLATMLSQACSVVTVNSTAAQQALWRNLPVKSLGRAIYNKPGLASDQALGDFFQQPRAPDPGHYGILRDYLLQTSQIPGGFYSERSRSHALRIVADLILAPDDPYETLGNGRYRVRQQITDSDS